MGRNCYLSMDEESSAFRNLALVPVSDELNAISELKWVKWMSRPENLPDFWTVVVCPAFWAGLSLVSDTRCSPAPPSSSPLCMPPSLHDSVSASTVHLE
ncbi:hypothetical protein DPX16_22435 [Anabarilius grahami]|uniref:Uncharacterized protein n=1 Tax=Anabarilius grahami TaxID=495550 RepID=A0A3N0YYH0_ANAGA|nr:hypothetical protein DPX16_22435 [Anabarilius grahami]